MRNLLTFDELLESNLKGFGYYVSAWSMSMTSRHSYNPELWVVIEDNGDQCIVAQYQKSGNYYNCWTQTLDKNRAAKNIHDFPCMTGSDNHNFIQEII